MKTPLLLPLALAATLLQAACGTTPSTGDSEDRSLLRERAAAALNDFKNHDPSLEPLLNSSNAYVIFPRITTAAIGAGGAYGRGEVYQKGKFIGYADVSLGSLGLQLGVQRYAELIIFHFDMTFVDFTHGTYELDARASAIISSSGAATAADYSKGVLIFTLPESGIMAQAALGVQKFRYIPANQ